MRCAAACERGAHQASDEQPESMDDKPIFHFTAGGKRQTPLSPDAAPAIAAIRAQKNQREGSPLKGLNPTAIAFHPSAAAEQSGQQIGQSDAAFTRTFSGSVLSFHVSMAATPRFHRWSIPGTLLVLALPRGMVRQVERW